MHGVRLNRPDPSSESHSLAVTVRDIERGGVLHAMFNAYWEPLTFELPSPELHRPWRRWIDTSRDAPDDVYDWGLRPGGAESDLRGAAAVARDAVRRRSGRGRGLSRR